MPPKRVNRESKLDIRIQPDRELMILMAIALLARHGKRRLVVLVRPAPVKLPGHTEYEVQYSHLRQAVRWLGFQERYLSLPQFLGLKPDTKVLCTGATYTIQRFCQAINKPFAVRAYTEKELQLALEDMLPKLQGLHYHDLADPAWFGLQDFKVLLLEKPGGVPKAQFTENKNYRW